MPVTPFLATHDCAACGLPYLYADTYSDGLYPIDQPIRVAPFLLNQTGQAQAILANIPLFHIELTKRDGYVCRRFFYDMPPKQLATFERSAYKAGTYIGIAALHIHRTNPPGTPIPDLTDHDPGKDIQKYELLDRLIAKHPELESQLRDILTPPPF